ncbi:MAG: hypothetical protein P8L85_11390 [Rubripirellula sp.]|nr:hypothetical protein [Rubripirellula sp.]
MTKSHFLLGTLILVIMALPQASADKPGSPAIEVSGVFPRLALVADQSHQTEAGTLMPWADRLWLATSIEIAFRGDGS